MLEIVEGHETRVGEIDVVRVLPRRARRTVGAWCFVDLMGPATVEATSGIDVAPHPHTGLQTVTWLHHGEVLHRDSLGTEQTIVPGQLNLMTAGHGIAHSEEHTGSYAGELAGVQLWIAQPESTRHGAGAFDHLVDLPQVDLPGVEAIVMVGSFEGAESGADVATPLVGVDLLVRQRSSLPLEPSFENAMVVLEGTVRIDDEVVAPRRLAWLGDGRDEVVVEPVGAGPVRVLLLGGEPLDEPPLLWWNFVARTREEIEEAHASWVAGDGRFGAVRSDLPRIIPDAPPWARR